MKISLLDLFVFISVNAIILAAIGAVYRYGHTAIVLIGGSVVYVCAVLVLFSFCQFIKQECKSWKEKQ